MKNIKIHPIPLFREDTKYDRPRMTYFFNFGKDMTTYCYIWLIEGTNEKIIIDAGSTPEMAIERGAKRDNLTHIQYVNEGLSKYNLECSDIDTVIITHLHWDHIALANIYTNAKLLVQEAEINFGLNPHPSVFFYEKNLYANLKFEVIKGDCTISEGVTVILTPGHTPGTQSTLIETGNRKIAIAGFCCLQENFEPEQEIKNKMPLIVPGIHLNYIQAFESMMKIKEMADTVIANHDARYADMESIS